MADCGQVFVGEILKRLPVLHVFEAASLLRFLPLLSRGEIVPLEETKMEHAYIQETQPETPASGAMRFTPKLVPLA